MRMCLRRERVGGVDVPRDSFLSSVAVDSEEKKPTSI
jgi:hypothetical protein